MITPKRSFDAEQLTELGRFAANRKVERAEFRIAGARLVEAHLVDQLLEHQRIVGEEIDAPFPIVEADRTRNDLRDLAGVAAADHAVLAHQVAPLFDIEAIPVVCAVALLVHRVEAEVAARWNFRKKARRY